MVGSGLQPDFVQRCFPGYSHGHAAFPARRTRLFCSCFVQLALRAQTGTKHERQRAPHDGSLATVCGDSRGNSFV